MDIVIRPFAPAQAGEVSRVIGRSLLELNAPDYALEDLQSFVEYYCPQGVLDLAAQGHTFVAMEGETVVGTASVTPDGTPGQAIIQGFFMLPEYAGRGIGARLLSTLEADPIFTGAGKVVVSASITAHPFYAKFGYRYKDGVPVCEDNDHYWMEK